eukprot:8214803-Alexandrium_andersonii.AAC.1
MTPPWRFGGAAQQQQPKPAASAELWPLVFRTPEGLICHSVADQVQDIDQNAKKIKLDAGKG